MISLRKLFPFDKPEIQLQKINENLENMKRSVLTKQRPSTVTATSPGTAGEIRYNGTYLYICVEDNQWKRITLSSF